MAIWLALAALAAVVSSPSVSAQLLNPLAAPGAGAGAKTGEPVTVTAQLLPAHDGQPPRLAVTATIEPGWHIYSTTQGAGGPIATRIEVAGSDQFDLPGEFAPDRAPAQRAEALFGGLVVESHEGQVTWSAPVGLAAGVDLANVEAQGTLRYQACTDKTCLAPKTVRFTATLGEPRQAMDGPGGALAAADLPPGEAGAPGARAEARPSSDDPNAALADDPRGAAEQVRAIFADLRPQDYSVDRPLALILILALLGGLILNVMPCVLPVIGLKLLAFVQQAGESRGRVFWLNVCYCLGLLSVFMVLAGLAAIFNLGWGEQFQSMGFNVAMVTLVFAMALSFLGVWEIPIPGFVGGSAANRLATREGVAGAFAKGVLTTILATPCSGPFLGPVIGFTLRQPPYVTFAVFGCMGLGMASPYLLIGAFPRLIRFLPKPGAWMDTLKQLMAFVLLGTVVYFFTIINEKYFVPTLALLMGVWFACWWIGRTPLTASWKRVLGSWVAGAGTATAVGVLAFRLLVPGPSVVAWKPFSPAELDGLLDSGHTVMVDFTADWCLNCKTNEALVYNTSAVARRLADNGVIPMVADYTDQSAEIKEMLALLGSRSIPLLAIFPADRPREPIVLRDLVTKEQVLSALDSAGPSRVARSPQQTALARP